MGKNILWVIVPFCSIFIFVGGGLMWHSLRLILQGCRANYWPHTVGKIVDAESHDTSYSEGNSREIKVKYAYTVAGQEYEGTRIHACYGSSSMEQAHVPLERLLQKGTLVRVYHDPVHPDQSSLATGFFSGSLALFFGGVIFAAAGFGFLFTFWFAIAGDWNFASGIRVGE